MCGHLLHAPYLGAGPQQRHVPGLGIKTVTLFGSQARAQCTEPNQLGLFSVFELQLSCRQKQHTP